MEWFWYFIASIGAGIGTGLAGLSAATVMVPILIVLCPSFLGETGAYQATAIALTSDILGSAVTTYTYIKHRNIDLKRGWIMLVCVVLMSTVGSYIAFIVGNVILGSFTLFLTFFIGIRFLVKPDSNKSNQISKGESLNWKEIIISLFFGLTIGFGTGFVGTGGGMMMLVVFTFFLRMELKTAVGTSTFIMTFTALIASVIHILIHPAIILEKWPVLIFCVFITTFASLISARFANRVNNRTVGLTTGFVLTILGIVMLIINYWNFLIQYPLVEQILYCLKVLIIFLVPSVLILICIHFFTKIPSYIFRKLLHIVAFTCITIMIVSAKSWQAAAITSIMIAIIAYPLLMSIERELWYSKLFVEKEPGEIKKSLLLLFFMFAALISICWGIFGQPDLAVTAILMWGTGDAAAALVGIPFGRHKVKSRWTDGKKSWEGSFSMFIVSFLVGTLMLKLLSPPSLSLIYILLWAFVSSLFGTMSELVSPSEYDTVTVPVIITIILLVMKGAYLGL